MNKRRIRLMAEEFVKTIEKKYEHLLKEAEEAPNMEHPINPESNTGRLQVIDYLVDPAKYGSQKTGADQNKARQIAAAIVKQGENARLLDPKNSSKVPIRHNKLVGGKGKDTVEQSNQKTQDHELAVEMLMAAYNTPNGTETPFQLGLADPAMKENIKRGLIMMFNIFDDNGDPGPLLRMVYGNAYHSPNPAGLPPIPVKMINGVEVKDTMAMRDYAYEAYSHLLQGMDSILTRKVNPNGLTDGGNWQKTMAYVNTMLRNKLKQVFKKERQTKGDWTGVQGAPGYSMDAGFNDKDAQGAGDAKMFYATQQGAESLFDLAKGDVGLQALKDIRDELLNLDGEKYKAFFQLPDTARMPRPKPFHMEALQAIIDNLEGESTHLDADGNEYMGGKYKSWTDFVTDLVTNPSEKYPALSAFVQGADYKKVETNLRQFFGGKLFNMARDYVYKTKYEKAINPNADSPSMEPATVGSMFGTEKQVQSDKWKAGPKSYDPAKDEEDPDGPSYVDTDYDEYYANLEEQRFMSELHESVGLRIFEHLVHSMIFQD